MGHHLFPSFVWVSIPTWGFPAPPIAGWMVYHGQYHENGWWLGYPYFRKPPHITSYHIHMSIDGLFFFHNIPWISIVSLGLDYQKQIIKTHGYVWRNIKNIYPQGISRSYTSLLISRWFTYEISMAMLPEERFLGDILAGRSACPEVRCLFS